VGSFILQRPLASINDIVCFRLRVARLIKTYFDEQLLSNFTRSVYIDTFSDMKSGLKVIVTGSTGMVGEGVMHQCLQNPDIEQVLVINRKASGVVHPKLKEIVHADFFNLSAIASQLGGYDACFFCLGVTSVGKKADEYYKYTYTLTMHMGETLAKLNPGKAMAGLPLKAKPKTT
jgi:hypothetical protein